MKWIQTYKGYLVKASEVESVGIGRKEEIDRRTGKTYEAYVVWLRTKSGAVYDYQVFVEEGQAKEALQALYQEVEYQDTFRALDEWLEKIYVAVEELKEALEERSTV